MSAPGEAWGAGATFVVRVHSPAAPLLYGEMFISAPADCTQVCVLCGVGGPAVLPVVKEPETYADAAVSLSMGLTAIRVPALTVNCSSESRLGLSAKNDPLTCLKAVGGVDDLVLAGLSGEKSPSANDSTSEASRFPFPTVKGLIELMKSSSVCILATVLPSAVTSAPLRAQ